MKNLQPRDHILVIKHGAFGDFILALSPFAAIRTHHPMARITLLTTPLYKKLMKNAPYFDEIWVDEKPKLYQPFKLWNFFKRLQRGHFTFVYDLQTSSRTNWYYKLWPFPKPKWSGIAKGCSHPHKNPRRDFIHTIDRQREQLKDAGLSLPLPKPDLSWLKAEITPLPLKDPFFLLVPGGSSHRPEKRWPASFYLKVAEWLLEKGIQPILIGTKAEKEITDFISTACSRVLNLTDQTSFEELASIGRKALGALGNDNGPMHLLTALNCPSLVLYSQTSNPDLCGQKGEKVVYLRKEDLKELPSEEVIKVIGTQILSGF